MWPAGAYTLIAVQEIYPKVDFDFRHQAYDYNQAGLPAGRKFRSGVNFSMKGEVCQRNPGLCYLNFKSELFKAEK
jgi:hypothetical protein